MHLRCRNGRRENRGKVTKQRSALSPSLPDAGGFVQRKPELNNIQFSSPGIERISSPLRPRKSCLTISSGARIPGGWGWKTPKDDLSILSCKGLKLQNLNKKKNLVPKGLKKAEEAYQKSKDKKGIKASISLGLREQLTLLHASPI